MLLYLRTSIFDSPAQTLVNTVNTVGVMGKGIAKQFKMRYPKMFREYQDLCHSSKLSVGSLHLSRGPDQWVLNFPTKTTWRLPSKIECIEEGLRKFADTYEEMGIRSISFPPLGCGNGNLDWSEVRPLMESSLKNLPIQVFIHDRQVRPGFVPEHFEENAQSLPDSYIEFLKDIRAIMYSSKGQFRTLGRGTDFEVSSAIDNDDLRILRNSKVEIVPEEEIENAWAALQNGVLSSDQFSGERSRRYKSYLFALLADLPYVRVAEIQHVRQGNSSSGHGLFFGRNPAESKLMRPKTEQIDLWESL